MALDGAGYARPYSPLAVAWGRTAVHSSVATVLLFVSLAAAGVPLAAPRSVSVAYGERRAVRAGNPAL